MALARDRKRINVKGGGKFYMRQIDPSPSNTYLDPGYLAGTSVLDEPTMVDSVEEAGNFVDTKVGATKATVEITMEQSGIDELGLMQNADGKYYEGYYPVLLANGNSQEWSFPLMKLKPGFNLNFAAATKRQIKLPFTLLAPKAAYVRGVTAFNVVANGTYIVVEGANATFNTANTEAAALATAIL